MFGLFPFPAETFVEKVHGLQCTGISLHERFTISTKEYLSRISRLRNRQIIGQNQRLKSPMRNQMSLRLKQQGAWIQPVKQRLGMPGLRRFGSEGNLPGLRRSISFSQLTNRIPWNSFRSPSRAGSVSNVSNASWHGGTKFVRRRGDTGQYRGLRGRGRQRGQRGRQQLGQLRQQRARAAWGALNRTGNTPRGRGRGRGGVYRNQQNRKNLDKDENQPNNYQNNNLTNNQPNRNQIRNQQNRNPVKLLTKEQLDAQLDQYMALSQHALDKELDEYMMKGALMDFE